MATTANFYKSVGRRGPLSSKQYPNVSISEIAGWYPKSVFASLISNANWIAKLNISTQAMRLTRLRGRQFRTAVQKIISHS